MNFNVENVVPTDINILIQPKPIKKIRTLQINPVGGSVQDVKGADVKEVEKKYEKLPTHTRLAEVLAVPEGDRDFGIKKGDTIIYLDNNAGLKLDLLASKSDDIKCPVMIKYFNVLAKVTKNEQE